MRITEAIILAGGMGTRLREAVFDVPKPMAPIGNRYAHLVYKTAWELHTLSGFSPEQARYIRVWFYKIGGTGCFSTDDWCLTEMEARERSNSEQGSDFTT